MDEEIDRHARQSADFYCGALPGPLAPKITAILAFVLGVPMALIVILDVRQTSTIVTILVVAGAALVATIYQHVSTPKAWYAHYKKEAERLTKMRDDDEMARKERRKHLFGKDK